MSAGVVLLLIYCFFANTSLSKDLSWKISVFSADITPPLGHPLLAIRSGDQRALRIVDPLFAKGLVLHGPAQPIVMVGVDWCELRNDAYSRWREVLARAAGTTIDRVLVSCLHFHDAPYFDLTAQKLIASSPGGGAICDLEFHEHAVQNVAQSIIECLTVSSVVTHIGIGKAKVDQIASNRRVVLPGGEVTFGRGSRTADLDLRNSPEGEIDPCLRVMGFWRGDQLLAEVSSYAVHPMSYYGFREVSSDFIGLARARHERDRPGVLQIYLTGCAGDVTTGKYNDGMRPNRAVLADRLYSAIREASRKSEAERYPVTTISCRSIRMILPHSELPEHQPEVLRQQLASPQETLAKRAKAALGLSSIMLNPDGHPIDIQVIDFGVAHVVLLPGESFVHYQILAQRIRPDLFTMAIGYGESATGYIPTERAVREGFLSEGGGYCWVGPGAEAIIEETLKKALAKSSFQNLR